MCSADGLLRVANGGGNCKSWAQLLFVTLAINGVVSQGIHVDAVLGLGFMVQNWHAVAPDPPNCENPKGMPTIAFAADYGEMVPSPTDPKTIYCDYMSDNGLPGQNTPTPSEKFFGNHWIVMYAGTNMYYDPSYGVTYADAKNFQTKAVYGFVQALPGMGDLTGRVFLQDPTMVQIRFTPMGLAP